MNLPGPPIIPDNCNVWRAWQGVNRPPPCPISPPPLINKPKNVLTPHKSSNIKSQNNPILKCQPLA